MSIILTRQVVESIFRTQPARLNRILSHRTDLYDEIINASGEAQRRLGILFSPGELRQLRRRIPNQRFKVSNSEAISIKRFYMVGREFSGADSEVVQLIRTNDLGHLLQSDHLFEQRFVNELAHGNITFSRRPGEISLGRDPDRAFDVNAIAVPTNEIIYYRIARHNNVDGFRLAGLYPHMGPGSKTTRLAQIIPFGSEAAHSIHDVVNAHLWVLIQEQGLHRSYKGHIIHDIADALHSGINNNSTLRTQARSIIGNDLSLERIENYLNGLPFPTADTFSPANWPRYREIEMPLVL